MRAECPEIARYLQTNARFLQMSHTSHKRFFFSGAFEGLVWPPAGPRGQKSAQIAKNVLRGVKKMLPGCCSVSVIFCPAAQQIASSCSGDESNRDQTEHLSNVLFRSKAGKLT